MHVMKSFCRLLLVVMLILVSPVMQAQPSIGGFNVYYGHLHNHCNVSDGTGTADSAYNYAKNTAHLDFLSLSDHSGAISSTEWTGIQAAADAYNEPGVFTAFRGFEWSSSGVYGHVTVINSADYCTTASPVNTFPALCDWLNQRECVAFFNHPGRENGGGTEFSHFSVTPSTRISGMELWNKNDAFSDYYYNDGYRSNDGNKGYYDEALARGWRIGASGSEDNHWGNWGNYNNCRLAVLANANTREEIYNALKAKRFFSTLDKNIALSFNIDGSEMGSTLLPGSYPVVIQASDGDGEMFTQVKLVKNGTVLNTWSPGSANPVITANLTFSNNDCCYIIVAQADGNEAISSPIWISDGNLAPVVSLTSPSPGAVFPAPANINITTDAYDPDGTVFKAGFYNGTTLLGEVYTPPYTFNWTNNEAGNYVVTVKITDNLGNSSTSWPVDISVVNPGDTVTVSTQIASGPDDAEESDAGVIYNSSTDLELVYDTYNTAGNQTVGLRFVNAGLPPQAVINNAFIQFTCDEVTSGVCNLLIRAEAADNSAAITTAAFNISSRPATTSGITWSPPPWDVANVAAAAQKTPGIASLIQEIVNRAGYTASSAITVIITGTGTRTAEAFDGVSASSAKLYVTYSYPVINQLPTVSTTPVTGITAISGSGGGTVLSEGSSPVTMRGVCWNTAGNPTVADNVTTNGSGPGAYSSLLSPLLPVNAYFTRAYATNMTGTAYGPEIVFTTHANVPPLLTIQDVTVEAGQLPCYNATDTITVAGGTTIFNILPGAGATIIAGGAIYFLPNTTVHESGYLHGYIVPPEGPFCGWPASPMPSSAGGPAPSASGTGHSWARIYPNPATDKVIIDIQGSDPTEKVQVDIFGTLGEHVYTGKFSGSNTYEVSLSGKPAGLYVFLLKTSSRSASVRVIKQ